MRFSIREKLLANELIHKIAYQMKIWYYNIHHFFLQRNLKKRKSANVVFFASSLAMWRYQKLYELLVLDERFNCKIVLMPFKNYTIEDKQNNIDILSHFFSSKGINYINAYQDIYNAESWIKELNPDILFYPQPYNGLYNSRLDSYNYWKKLCCYHPYGLYTLDNPDMLNNDYQNLAWKVFLQTRYHVADAKRDMRNHGRNIVLTGDANSDYYTSNEHNNPWKPQSEIKKRIIWAPHFTVIHNFLLHRDSFLWMYQAILDFAEQYQDLVQIAFKPHPRLRTELYKHPDWGKDRTDDYFKKWIELENGQLEEGEFIDLFCTSDAIIHDSGSFIADYLFTGKPAIFTAPSKEDAYDGLNEFGIACMNCHYHAHDTDTAIDLLKSVVIDGKDPMLDKRLEFRDSVLVLNRDKTVAQVTYENIVTGLGWSLF